MIAVRPGNKKLLAPKCFYRYNRGSPEMQQKPRRNSLNAVAVPIRPGQDVVVAKKAAQFPSIGTTLPNYQYDPRDYHKRRLASGTPTKRGRLYRAWHKITLKRSVITVALLVLLLGGWVGGKFIYNAHKLFGGNILGVLTTTKLKGEDSGRVNILLAGNSADDPGHNGANLTDSIMLMSIDTKHNKAFLLSLPRDLWVHIPADGHQKINNAYVVGQDEDYRANGYPSGGMGLLTQIVSQNLGIKINYYALIDYKALEQSVDAVGGINLTIKSSDPRGLYDPNIDWATKGPLVKLTNGPHLLNGHQALDLARARGDSYRSYGFAASDFDRTEHQRQMVVALKTKAVSAGVLANPAKLSSLSDAIGNNVKTDFKLPEVRRLYELTKKIDSNSIQSLSLDKANGKNLLVSYSTPQGQSALIPAKGIDNFSDIQAFINRQTSSDPLVQEAARVVVLNGTTINGLAGNVQRKLIAGNIIVDAVGDARTSTQTTTSIIELPAGKNPATSAALKKLFGNNLITQNPYANIYDADFIIVLGTDQQSSVTNDTSNQGQP